MCWSPRRFAFFVSAVFLLLTTEGWAQAIDSDSDGVNDYREGKDGTDPNNATSFDPLSKGLAVYYPLDANFLDESGNTNNLVVSPGYSVFSTDRAGVAGGALAVLPIPTNTAPAADPDARAVGQRPNAVSASSLGIAGKSPRTISFWAFVKTLPVWNNGTFLQWGKESSGYFGLQYASRASQTIFLTDKNLVWDAGNGGAGIVTAPTNLTQTWRHFALTYDGGTNATFYLDGAKQDGSFAAQDLASVNTLETTLRVGVGFDGSLDEIRVYNRALSSSEVGRIYLRDAVADRDNDGVNDYREDKDGTDPDDPASFNLLSKGLVAYYPFDGSLDDESGFGADGVNAGATPGADRNGLAGRSLFFSGPQYVKVPDALALPSGASPRTVSCWVRSSDGLRGSNAAHAVNWGSANDSRAFGVMIFVGNTWQVYTHNTDTDSGVLAGTLWNHIAATYDGTTVGIYVNGVLRATRVVALDTTGQDLYFGMRPDVRDYFSGYVDDTRIYNRALSAAEVEQLYVSEAGSLDTDGDGLTDAAEFLLEGLGFDRRTNNAAQVLRLFNNPNNAFLYTLAQYNANRTNGRADVTTNPSAFNLYTQAQYDAFGALRFSNGVASVTTNPSNSGLYTQTQYDAFGAQRFSNGQTSVTTNPSAFNLYTLAQYTANRTNGRADVTNAPGSYGLFTQAQYDAFGTLRFSNGRADVTTNPSSFGLYTLAEYNANRTNGRADVTNAPGSYGLYTLAQFNANRTVGRTDVTTNPSAFGLFTQAQYDSWGVTNYHLGRLANASRTVYEGFRYAPSNLAGLGAGTGWSGPWSSVGGSETNSGACLSNSLTYIDPNGLKLLVSGGSARTSTSHVGGMRSFARGLSNGTVYLGFLMKSLNSAGINSYGGVSLFSSNNEERIFFGEEFNGANVMRLVAHREGGVELFDCGTISSGETKFVVLKIEFNAGTAPGNERVTVYINPSLQAESSAATYSFPNVPSFEFSKIRVQSGGGSPVQLVEIDEIRLGTTYGSVAPIDDDADGDGLLSGAELDGGTDPEKYDTNGDGLPDGQAPAPTPTPAPTPVPAPQVQTQPAPIKAAAKKAKPKPKPKPKPKTTTVLPKA